MINTLKGQRNSKKQGDVGMGVAIAYFVSNGFTVSIPITDSQDYDLVVDFDNRLQRVQVKTTCHKASRSQYYVANLKVCGGNKSGNTIKKFDNSTVDYLFILNGDGEMFLIPSSEIENTNSIALGKKCIPYKVS